MSTLLNLGKLYWTVDEAKSEECFNKKEYCPVPTAFADRVTAELYLEDRFGGLLYPPNSEESELIPQRV